VSGGNKGIGEGICRSFAEAGAQTVVIFYNSDPTSASSLRDELSSSYPNTKVLTYHCPADDPKRIQEIWDDLDELKISLPEVVIANAGISLHKDALECSPEDIDSIFGVNLKGPFYLAQVAARKWINESRSGVIIATASISGQIVNRPQRQCLYNSSKSALIHLYKSLAAEWAERGIRVLTVSPGYIDTAMLAGMDEERRKVWEEMVPMKKFAQPSEIGNLMVYLASDKSPYMTGSDVVIDGGYTLW